jgi:hypothetical protein
MATIGISIQNLQAVVQKDLLSETGGDQRYPWRFIIVPTLWGLAQVEDELKSCLGDCLHVVDVATEQREPDGIITSDDVVRLFDRCQDSDKSWVITGLSEVLRFKSDDDFEALIRSVTERENHGNERTNRRFYIPLAGLQERFQKLLWSKADRESAGLWPSVWNIEEQIGSVLKVVLLGQPLEVSNHPCIKSYREFLSLWRGQPVDSVVVTSRTVADLYDMAPKDVFPDAAVSISRISDYKRYLLDCLNVDVPVPFRSQDKNLWRRLTQEVQQAQEQSLRSVLCRQLNVERFDLIGCLKYWPGMTADPYLRWLLRVGILALYPNSYLAKCLTPLEEADTASLALALLSGPVLDKSERTSERLEERRRHLALLAQTSGSSIELPESLQEKLRELPPAERLAILTGTTHWERAEFVRLFAGSSVPRDLWFDTVERTFPALYDYVAPLDIEELPESLSWLNGYFNEYRASCLLNQPSESLKAMLRQVNSDEASFYKWYYAARKHEAAETLVQQGTRALMVDGMGWEWTPFIIRQLRRRGLDVTDLAPMAACLPSTTEFNRFGSGVTVTENSLDAVAHKAPYKHPQTLLEELEVMRSLLDAQLAQPDTVVMADHGLTAFSRSVAAVSKYQMEGKEHEGRCAWLSKTEKSCSDFLVYDVPATKGLPSGPVALALGYTSLDSVGTHLAHGGATPEEVLVPTFIVRPHQGTQQRYSIRQVVTAGSENARKVIFAVSPPPVAPPKAAVNHKELHVTHLASGNWCAQLPTDLAGTVNVDIAVEATTMTLSITIKAGMTERELF